MVTVVEHSHGGVALVTKQTTHFSGGVAVVYIEPAVKLGLFPIAYLTATLSGLVQTVELFRRQSVCFPEMPGTTLKACLRRQGVSTGSDGG